MSTTEELEDNRQPPDENNARLIEIKERLHMTRPQIAQITGYSAVTVDAWLVEEGPNARRVPERALRLLELETGLAKPRFLHLVTEAAQLERAIKG
jgi:DNA-binding transcriptional regulator YiaG